jgi:hypothetical protein
MTQRQLVCSVATATGESPRTVRALGFGLLTEDPDALAPEDLRLVLDCPFCRGPVPYPGAAPGGAIPLAGCPDCDVEFPFEPGEVYAASSKRRTSAPTPHGYTFTSLLI